MNVTNDEFVKAIFGPDHLWCHVTDFPYDPSAIPKDKHLFAWSGNYYSRYKLKPNTNQYFTISTFYCDEQQQARRRKALFRQTHCIVLDDVKEKLSMEQVSKLPSPSWILETSVGSEQWGYILNTPCTNRAQVENLLDGLVSNGLAPDGKDPGMKGVTRYVRLPEGVNNKASKLVNGVARQCKMLLWQPFNTTTMEQLAYPFAVDLNAIRREQRIDGAAAVSDHPLINIPDIIHIKEVRSDGRFDIRCPWTEEHTGADDSGAAIFTNEDGSIGFKCHHGACQHRTAKDLLQYIDTYKPNWSSSVLKNWQVIRDLDSFGAQQHGAQQHGAQQPTTPVATPEVPVMPEVPNQDPLDTLFHKLQRTVKTSPDARYLVSLLLKHADGLPKIEQKVHHDRIRDEMHWSVADFKDILKDLRTSWYADKVSTAEFYDDVVFVKELNQFYDFKERMFFTTEAFQNAFSHEDAEARKIALQDGRVAKVSKLDYAPKQPKIFREGRVVYGNLWNDEDQPQGIPGDVTPWRRHFEIIGWQEERDHIEKWMAFTLRYPETKINHALLFGGGEGCGKDFLLYPLTKGMGENAKTISGEELTDDFDDYILSTKYLHVNETDLADHKKAIQVSNKIKPLAAAPPERITVNQKGVKRIMVRNILNVSMTTNSYTPLKLNGASRRFFALWSYFNARDEGGQMKDEWVKYWIDHWNWMKQGGWKHVLHYLLNEVDLSTFNPEAPPKVTEFLKEIQDASKSPQQQTIEKFIEKRLGLFQCDLLTSNDISDTIRTEGVFSPNNVYCDTRYLTPVNVGRILNNAGYMKKRARQFDVDVRVFVLRNHDRYVGLSGRELCEEYCNQMTKVRGEYKNNKVVSIQQVKEQKANNG